jgi:hypothetical protein
MRFRAGGKKTALRLHLWARKAFDIGPYLILKVDDRPAGRTMLTKDGWSTLVLEPQIAAGEHVLSVEFANDVYAPAESQDRNVILADLEVISLAAPGRTPAKSKGDKDPGDGPEGSSD